MDIGASAKLELVDKFCYLGDMLSVDGDADAAVEARIGIYGIYGVWNLMKVRFLEMRFLAHYARPNVPSLT